MSRAASTSNKKWPTKINTILNLRKIRLLCRLFSFHIRVVPFDRSDRSSTLSLLRRFREGNHHRSDRYPENYRAIFRLDGLVDRSAELRLARYRHHYAFYYLANFTIVLTFPLLQTPISGFISPRGTDPWRRLCVLSANTQ